jgi:opacity protein-like surface antigen
MKNRMLFLLLLISGSGFSQLKEQSLQNLINEFHVSVNRGIGAERNFFGAGLGVNHVFRADQSLGARIGLQADFYHFWNGGVSGPEFNKYESRYNQHFNALNISVPFGLQVNFGYSVRYLFEMGAELGVNTTTRYSADIHSSSSVPEVNEHVTSTMNLGAFLGFNLGAGVRIPFNDAISLLVKPGVGVQAYVSGFKGDALTMGNAYAKLTLGILLQNY